MPPLRRRGRPGLLGTVARTAVIAGTAQATSNAVNRRQQQHAQDALDNGQATYSEAPLYPAVGDPPASAAVGPADSDLMTQLTQLAQLHQQGALTDEEFTAAKDKILGS